MSSFALPPLPDQLPLEVPQGVLTSGGLANFQDGETPSLGPGLPPITPPITIPQFTALRLKRGAWLFSWGKSADFSAPLGFGISDGTFRFEPHGGIFGSIRASGDIYNRPVTIIPRRRFGQIWIGPFILPGPPPPLDQGIPIFGIKQYQAYFRVTKVSSFITNNGFDMEFTRYNWDAPNRRFTTDAGGAPVIAENYTVRLTWTAAPAGWPNPADYLTGEVKIKSTGASAGFIRMGWMSPRFRKIGMEIDTVQGCNFPGPNAAGRTISNLLEDAGLQVGRMVTNESNIPDKPDGSAWADTDLHSLMVAHRQTVDLEKEWAYYCVVIPSIVHYGRYPFGLMFDDGTGDMNNVPREGFGVAAKSRTGGDSTWGTEASKDLQDSADAFARTTIHEFSHSLGLLHPTDMGETEDQTYTCPTISIVRDGATIGPLFPANIKWSHAPIAQTRLWHYPDIRVRPGGIQFQLLTQGGSPWIPPLGTPIIFPPIRFDVEPVLGEVPLGAPVRVEATITNEGDTPIDIPENIGLGGPAMKGSVSDPSGTQRPFNPFTTCVDGEDPLSTLEPGESVKTSMTLFSGGKGPLFPCSGVHHITATLAWTQTAQHGEAVTLQAEARTTVLVTGARSASHASAAHRVLAEPEAYLSLVLAGDHLKKGVKAVQDACKDETLGPHWSYIDARRCARGSLTKKPDLTYVKKILASKNTVLSEAERTKCKHLAQAS